MQSMKFVGFVSAAATAQSATAIADILTLVNVSVSD